MRPARVKIPAAEIAPAGVPADIASIGFHGSGILCDDGKISSI